MTLFITYTSLIRELQKEFTNTSLPPKFRNDIIYWAHNHVTAGHFEFVKNLDKLRKWYNWPLMYSDVECWIRGCTRCSQRKGNHQKY